MVDDEEIADTDRDWTDYWRLLFPKIDLNDIDEFEQKYKGCINFNTIDKSWLVILAMIHIHFVF